MGNVRIIEKSRNLKEGHRRVRQSDRKREVGGRKDMANLPYIEAITKESMRLHPPAIVLPPKVATNGDTKVLGFDIPEGTQVIVNVWAIGRDPTILESPTEFKPEKFISKDIDVIGHHFELLPFGAGKRICPGYPLALKVVKLSLANLVHGFSWSLSDHMNEKDLNMEEIPTLTCFKKQPLEAAIEPRLSSNDLYLQRLHIIKQGK